MYKLYLTFAICLSVGLYHGYGQSDCFNALPVCTDANSGGVVNGLGNDDFAGRTESGCLKLGLGVQTIETNSFWFRVKLAESGQFGFSITPNNTTEDWDFAVYGPNANCAALISPVACNYSKTSTTGSTGVGIDPATGTKTEAFDDWLNVQAGDEYLILVNQYAGNNAGFNITWQGAIYTNNQPLDCSILVDLGPDRELCEGESTTLNASTFGANISYEWFEYSTLTNNYESFSPAVTTATLDVSTTGDYRVEVTDNNTNMTLSDEIIVTFHTVPIVAPIDDLVACDENNDGIEAFNLEVQTPLLQNGQPGVVVTYHESEVFAQSDVANITGLYDSTGTTIWARIENGTTNCFELISFDLVVTTELTAIKPPDIVLCDDNDDKNMIFNIDQQIPIITNGELGILTFYTDESDAIDRKGWLLNTDAYQSTSRTIWARFEASPGSPCNDIISFELIVLETPEATKPTDIQQCDTDNDGLYEFDLNALKDADIIGSLDMADFEVTYFPSQTDADNNTKIISMPYTNATPYAMETIFARIQNKESLECFDTTSFTLQVFDTAFPALPSEIPNLLYCDNDLDGDDTNGFITFDLTERASDVLNGQSPIVFNVDYFHDAAFTNPINNPTNFINTTAYSQTIHVRISSSNPNNTSCFSATSFDLEVRPLPVALLTPFELIQCDEDGNPDGIVDFDLEQADTFITLGNNNLFVTYHLSNSDAVSGTNALNKNAFSNSVSNIVFGRILDPNGCFRIVTVNLSVSTTAFPAIYYRVAEECDDDGVNDGVHTFNLGQYTSEILLQFNDQNLRVAYYRNQNDALTETNSISTTVPFTNETVNSQIIWVRVESSINGGCFGVAPILELMVLPIPEFDLDTNGHVCLNNIPFVPEIYNEDGIYTYEWKDQNGMIVSISKTAEITQAGTYTVIATSNIGCDSFPREIIVEESNIASIELNDIQITDNSKDNTISISSQNLGIGSYEYALNNIDGPYQDTAEFTRVPPGVHSLFVRDKNGCGTAQIIIYVFGFPQFFTPNNDGYNDTWNIQGVDPSLLTNSTVYIFDRYGKILTIFNASQTGWDGTYNNDDVLSSDYWFLAEITDVNGNSSQFRGHFSLIRR